MVGEEKAKLACKAMLATFLLRTEEQSGVAVAHNTRQTKYAGRRQLKLPHMQRADYIPEEEYLTESEKSPLWNIQDFTKKEL